MSSLITRNSIGSAHYIVRHHIHSKTTGRHACTSPPRTSIQLQIRLAAGKFGRFASSAWNKLYSSEYRGYCCGNILSISGFCLSSYFSNIYYIGSNYSFTSGVCAFSAIIPETQPFRLFISSTSISAGGEYMTLETEDISVRSWSMSCMVLL